MRNVRRIVFALVSATVGSLLTFTLVTCKAPTSSSGRAYATPAPSTTSAALGQASAPPSPLLAPLSERARTEDEQNTITVFARTAQACVFVTQQQLVVDYWARRAHEIPAGSGSGFVWDADGHIVTNYHVVANAQKLTVTLQDQRTFVARVVGAEPRKDIAVLKIDAPAQALVPIARHTMRVELEVGQKVIAIGNPFGLDQTLTTGIVSALGRQVDGIGGVTIREMVQTDAAINPGNSGGPLIDSTGRLIGMNTMIYSRSGASAGIGFAVPVQTIERIVPQLIRSGKAEQVGLGIEIDPQQRIERRLGMRGVVVISVGANTSAGKAGLQGLTQTAHGLELGDVVVAIDKKPIQNYDDLYNSLDGRRIGETVMVTVIRGRKSVELSVPLVALQ